MVSRAYFGVGELYPRRPIQIVTPRGASVRYGSRVVYADVPLEVYELYSLWWAYYNEPSSEGRENIRVEIE